MKRININLLQNTLIALAILLVGCQDYLDVAPESVWESSNFYSTPKEAEIALAGIYGRFATSDAYGLNLIALNAGTDETYYNRRFNESWTVSLFRNTPSDRDSFELWTNHYQSINLANLFLESIDRSSFESDEEYNVLVAEAKFLRALSYFTLTNFWEEIPLRLSSSKNQDDNNKPAASLNEIYNSIIDDFTFASDNLPHPQDDLYVPGRAHRFAAHGLLARVYLKMSGYPLKENHYKDVITHCEAVINSGFHGLESGNEGYRNLFLDLIGGDYNLKEVLFEISFDNLRDQGIGSPQGRLGAINGLLFNVTASNVNLGFPNGFSLEGVYPNLAELYNEENDKRYEWNIASYSRESTGDIKAISSQMDGRRFCPAKYRRWEPLNYADIDVPGVEEPYVVLENSSSELSRNFTSVNFPIIRYADVLLMYAEAANEMNNGPTPLAIDYLDEVRNRAGLGAITIEVPTVVTNKQLFFDELVDERSRELCFEGVRRFDLIRWELFDEKLAEVKTIVEGHPDFSPNNANHVSALRGPINFDISKHLSLPYPLVEISINQELDQKLGW